MMVDWGCENQIGYIVTISALTGSLPIPVYCRRSRPQGHVYCETCESRRASGDTSLVRFGVPR